MMKLRKKHVRLSRGSFSERRALESGREFRPSQGSSREKLLVLDVSWRLECVCACVRITCRQQVLVDRGRTPHLPPPPTFVKYFVLFFVLFKSVPGEPDAGLTHFLSKPRLHTRPHIFPATSAPPQWSKKKQKTVQQAIIGQRIGELEGHELQRAQSHEARHMQCVWEEEKKKKKNISSVNYSCYNSCLFGKSRKCCNKKTIQVEKQMLEQPGGGWGVGLGRHICAAATAAER